MNFNFFVFRAIRFRLDPDFNTRAFGYCIIFLGHEGTAPSSPRVAVRIWPRFFGIVSQIRRWLPCLEQLL